MTFFAVVAFILAVAMLILGIRSMAHGGAYDAEHGTRFMGMRVLWQGVAFVLLLLAMLSVTR